MVQLFGFSQTKQSQLLAHHTWPKLLAFPKWTPSPLNRCPFLCNIFNELYARPDSVCENFYTWLHRIQKPGEFLLFRQSSSRQCIRVQCNQKVAQIGLRVSALLKLLCFAFYSIYCKNFLWATNTIRWTSTEYSSCSCSMF